MERVLYGGYFSFYARIQCDGNGRLPKRTPSFMHVGLYSISVEIRFRIRWTLVVDSCDTFNKYYLRLNVTSLVEIYSIRYLIVLAILYNINSLLFVRDHSSNCEAVASTFNVLHENFLRRTLFTGPFRCFFSQNLTTYFPWTLGRL